MTLQKWHKKVIWYKQFSFEIQFPSNSLHLINFHQTISIWTRVFCFVRIPWAFLLSSRKQASANTEIVLSTKIKGIIVKLHFFLKVLYDNWQMLIWNRKATLWHFIDKIYSLIIALHFLSLTCAQNHRYWTLYKTCLYWNLLLCFQSNLFAPTFLFKFIFQKSLTK